jgi:hypothetical protein
MLNIMYQRANNMHQCAKQNVQSNSSMTMYCIFCIFSKHAEYAEYAEYADIVKISTRLASRSLILSFVLGKLEGVGNRGCIFCIF